MKKCKKIIWVLVLAISLSSVLNSIPWCGIEVVEASELDYDFEEDDEEWDDEDIDLDENFYYELSVSELKIGNGDSRSVKLYDEDRMDWTTYAKWSSKNKKIATVDEYGKVTGIKVGKTVITAKFDGQTFECNVTVIKNNPTYAEAVKKAKKLADGKNIIYKTINAGKHARLYGIGCAAVWDEKIKSELFGRAGSFTPYVDIKAGVGKAIITYGVKCKVDHFSYDSMEEDFEKLQFANKNRKVSFELYNIDETENYQYNKGIYKGTFKANAIISSNKNKNKANVAILKKILDGKEMRLKIYSSNGAYAYAWYGKDSCKDFKRIYNAYNALLKLN